MLIAKKESLCGNSWGQPAKYGRGVLMQKYQEASIFLVCLSVCLSVSEVHSVGEKSQQMIFVKSLAIQHDGERDTFRVTNLELGCRYDTN